MNAAGSQNAMTEVALALAMAFFCLMILSLVSMMAGTGAENVVVVAGSTKTVQLEAGQPQDNASTDIQENDTRQLIIYRDGGYYDQTLDPISIGDITTKVSVLLAISPDTSLSEAIKAKARISSTDVLISTLTEDWLHRIEQFEAKGVLK